MSCSSHCEYFAFFEYLRWQKQQKYHMKGKLNDTIRNKAFHLLSYLNIKLHLTASKLHYSVIFSPKS